MQLSLGFVCRGFHVAFDILQHKSLGYILPSWLEGQKIRAVGQLNLDASATRLVLPLKPVCDQSLT